MDDVTRIEDGKVAVFKRGGVYCARICISPNKYVVRSLRTGKHAVAVAAARKLFYQLEAKVELGLPLSIKRTSDVMDEYIAYRTMQHAQGRTSEGMLRQLVRVTRFWREYAGERPITSIDNAALKEFEAWRRDYYVRIAPNKRPPNAKLRPQDKEVLFNVAAMRGVLRWAHDKGYMGRAQLPTYTFKAKNKRVRPAFELSEYRQLLRGLLRWERDCTVAEHLHTRQLLRDYVLILAKSGMRVGEANSLRNRDVQQFTDALGRKNYRFIVRGKTGERDVIARTGVVRHIERLMARKSSVRADDWFFSMRDGGKIITLIDQFNNVLKLSGVERNSAGLKYSLYSLRHFYAVMALRSGIGVFDIARNMGTSVQMIQQYYGKQATAMSMATTLGGKSRKAR